MSEFRKRLVDPMLPPIIAAGFIFVLVFSVSRILLAIPEKGSTTMALLVAAEVLGVASVLAATAKLKASQRLVLAFIGLGLVGGGAAAASIGVRPIENHGGEPVAISAKGIKFSTDTLEFPVDAKVKLTFANNDAGIPHNVAITSKPGGSDVLFSGKVVNGPTSVVYEVEPLAKGTYGFFCAVHPTAMTGTLLVGQEAPAPKPTPTALPSSPAATPTPTQPAKPSGQPTEAAMVAKDFSFDPSELTLAANSAVTIHFSNQGAQPHNWSVYKEKGGPVVFQDLKFVNGGEHKEYTFTSPAPGTYYFQCDVHPAQMTGRVTFS